MAARAGFHIKYYAHMTHLGVITITITIKDPIMNSRILIYLMILSLSAPVFWSSVYGGDETLPDRFDYTFKNAAPIKIYSGSVQFEHKRHIKRYQLSCSKCHHTLGQGETEVEETCIDCHTEAGFIRGADARDMDEDDLMAHYLNALHTQCINCHIDVKLQNLNSQPPISCTRCHIRSSSGAEASK